MSKLFVDDIVEKTSNHGVVIPGHIIQIVQATSTTTLQMSSNNAHVDTGLTGSITPSATSSKILILHNSAIVYNNTHDFILYLVRGSSNIYGLNLYSSTGYGTNTAAFSYLDSPATTSAVTYKTTVYKNQGEVFYNYNNEITSKSTLTFMEIAQ
tara:strand:+ start:640 stop:1101 length:462 start_codon:yes stop_codon:yes gene_type:complete